MIDKLYYTLWLIGFGLIFYCGESKALVVGPLVVLCLFSFIFIRGFLEARTRNRGKHIKD